MADATAPNVELTTSPTLRAVIGISPPSPSPGDKQEYSLVIYL